MHNIIAIGMNIKFNEHQKLKNQYRSYLLYKPDTQESARSMAGYKASSTNDHLL